MPHIHQQPGEFDHTASAYIIRTDFSEPRLFLHKHKLLGKWMQPGGHIELDEDPWQTLEHEIREETGYDMSQLHVLQPKDRLQTITVATLHPLPFVYLTHPFEGLDHKHTDSSFAFVTDQAPTHAIAEGESQEYMFVTRSELAKVDTIAGVREICEFLFDTVLENWEAVPTTSFKSS